METQLHEKWRITYYPPNSSYSVSIFFTNVIKGQSEHSVTFLNHNGKNITLIGSIMIEEL